MEERALSRQQAPLPPIVLLHGWGGTFESTWIANGWRERVLAHGRRLINLDLPGHGAAPDAADPSAYADMAALVVERLPHHGRFDFVGYSLGAKLTLAIAARHPRLVRRAVVCGLGGNVFGAEPLGAELASLLENGVPAGTAPALAGLVRYGLEAGNDPRRIAAVLRRPANPRIDAATLAAVRCPVLLAVGDGDQVAMPVEPLAAALPHAGVMVLPGVDHLSLPAQPALVEAALDFLAG